MPTISPQVTPYYGGGQQVNPANVLLVTGAPSVKLIHEKVGSLAVDTSAGTMYGLVSVAGGMATWAVLGGSTSAIDSLSGNTGGQLAPLGGNIQILGAGPLSFAGSGSILTGSIVPGTFLVSQLQGNSGGVISPVAGLIHVVGSGAVSVAGSGSTLTISVAAGSSFVSTLTGNSGGALSPSSGNISVLGSGPLAFAGSGSTLTGSIVPGSSLVATITGEAGPSISPVAGDISITGAANQIFTTNVAGDLIISVANPLVAPGAVSATTSLTAISGNITATNGNLVLTAAGNKMVRSSVASTSAAGANSIGSVVLVGGTVTVSTSAVTASSLIQIWRQSVGATGATNLGILSVGTIVAGVSFDINAWQVANATSLQASDVSVVGWEIIN